MAISVKKSPIFPTPVYLTPPFQGFPLELGISARGQKTRLMGLPDGPISFNTGLAIETQYQHVTDRQTDRQTRCDSKDRAYILRRTGNNSTE